MIIQFAALLAIIPGARLDGIGHVAYLVLPEIAEMARETKVCPERPLGIAVIASQQAMALRHRPLHHVGIALLSGRHGTYCYALGIALSINPMLLVALFPAVNGYFFFPNYPTVVAAINFDRTEGMTMT